jgi:hypothetical protein
LLVVFPGAPDRSGLDERVTRIRDAGMAAVATQLRRDTDLRALAERVAPTSAAALTCRDDRCTTLLTDATGTPIVDAGQDGSRLVLFVQAPSASMLAPTLLHAALAAAAPFPYEEREPRSWTPEALSAIERPGSDPPAELFRNERTGLRRVVWIGVLVLLAAETWMRRTRDEGSSRVQGREARVA